MIYVNRFSSILVPFVLSDKFSYIFNYMITNIALYLSIGIANNW